MVNKTLARQLALCASKAPSADNSQPCHYIWDGSTLKIQYDEQRVAGRTFPARSVATALSIGAMVESLSLINEDYNLGLDICYTGDNDANLLASITVPSVSPAVDSLTDLAEHPVFKRHTNRLPYRRTPVPEELIEKLTNLHQERCEIMVLSGCDVDGKRKIQAIAEAVKSASQIRFQTQEVHEWLGKSLRFHLPDECEYDGLDIDTLGLPPGGSGLLRVIKDWRRMNQLNKIGAYKLLSVIDSQPIKNAPGLLAIQADNTHEGAINAGRLLARAWMMINQQGLAAHPYYVVADQLDRLRNNSIPTQLVEQAQELQQTTTQLFGLTADKTHFMLLRFGYASKPAVLSKRIPLDQLFIDVSDS